MNRLIIILVTLTMTGCFGKQPEKTTLKGTKLPSFKLLLTDSVTYIDTKNVPNNKPVVMLYFGPHCPVSRAQLEDLINSMSFNKDINYYLLTTWPFLEMKKFYNDYQLYKYKNVTVGLDFKNFFPSYFNAPGVPYTAIYNKDRKLNDTYLGKVDSDVIIQVAER